jgi:hypothetical protein
MRGYKITLKAQPAKNEGEAGTPAKVRFGGSQSEAAAHKKALLEEAGLRPQADANQVTIDQIDIPTGKADLVPFLNKLVS